MYAFVSLYVLYVVSQHIQDFACSKDSGQVMNICVVCSIGGGVQDEREAAGIEE
jgi:hypothetical protein